MFLQGDRGKVNCGRLRSPDDSLAVLTQTDVEWCQVCVKVWRDSDLSEMMFMIVVVGGFFFFNFIMSN